MAITFSKRPIYLGDRIILTGSYEAGDTVITTAAIPVPGILIDAIAITGLAPTNIVLDNATVIGGAGTINLATQAVLSADRRGFQLFGIDGSPATNNGAGKFTIYGRRA